MENKTHIAAWREGARAACRALAEQTGSFLTCSFVGITVNAMVDEAVKARKTLVPMSDIFFTAEEEKTIAYSSYMDGAKLVLDAAKKYDVAFISDSAMEKATAKAFAITMGKFKDFCSDHGI